MARGDPLIRQWNLLRLLQSYRFGLAVDELADRLDCSERQVKRDLSVLMEVGFPIEFDRREFGKRFWKLAPKAVNQDNVLLSLTEMISLFLSRQLLAPLAGTQFGDGLFSALDKIKTLLPDKALLHFLRLDEQLFVKSMPGHDYSDQDKEIRIINKAIADSRVLKVSYHSASSDRTYEWQMHPYGIVLFDMSLYCVGLVVERDYVCTLKMERFLGVEMTSKSFERPEEFSLQDYLHGSFGIFAPGKTRPVHVKFTGWAAVNVRETRWHPSQSIIEDGPEHVVVQFRLANTIDFKRWVLGFGKHAVVVRPKELAEEIAQELMAAQSLYADR